MTQNRGYSRAQEEQIRRQEYYERYRKSKKSNQKKSNYESSEGFLNMSYHIWRVRTYAPYAFLTYTGLITIILLYFVFSFSVKLDKIEISLREGEVGHLTVAEPNYVYYFDLNQSFPGGKNPLYSELEIEILHQNKTHVYSFYKDLWQERHPNGEGGYGIYNDLNMKFELVFPEAGQYFIRPISHNNNNERIYISIEKSRFGTLYLFFYLIAFGIPSIVFLFGSSIWGSPVDMWEEMMKKKTYKKRLSIKLYAAGIVFILLSLVYINMNHIGYPKAGEHGRIPTKFYSKKEVIYLG